MVLVYAVDKYAEDEKQSISYMQRACIRLCLLLMATGLGLLGQVVVVAKN